MSDVRPKTAVRLREFWADFKLARKYRSQLRNLIEPKLHRRGGIDRRKLTTEVIDSMEAAIRGLQVVDHLERNRASPLQLTWISESLLSDGSKFGQDILDEDAEETIVAIAEEMIFTNTKIVPPRSDVIRELQTSAELRALVHKRILEQIDDGRPNTEAKAQFASKIAEMLFRVGIAPTVSAARDPLRSPAAFLRDQTRVASDGESLFIRVLRVLFEAAMFGNDGTLVSIAAEGVQMARLDTLR